MHITDLISRWYFADISGLSENATLVAKVIKGDKTGYSKPIDITVEENPISVKDIKISWSLGEFGNNEYFGYPTFSMWEGYSFNISTSFNNMPENATVKYSFADVTKNATKDNEYYNANINRWSGYGTKKIIATVTDGEKEYEFIVAEVIILIDPSGYVTDSETGKPIVGATALLEVKDGNTWKTWDAAVHMQQNPMLTDETGHYGWMVPEGEYRVIVSADGYATKIVETYDSKDYGAGSKITVLPVRTDVDITLDSNRNAELDNTKTASVAGGRVKFVFTRPIDASTITAKSLKVTNASGNAIAGSFELSDNDTIALFKPSNPIETGSYKLVMQGVKDMRGNELASRGSYI